LKYNICSCIKVLYNHIIAIMSLISMSNTSMSTTSMSTTNMNANKFGLKKTFDEQMQRANQLFAEVNEEYEEWEYEQKINAELDSVEKHTGGIKKNHLIDNKVAVKSKQGQHQQQQQQQQKDTLEKINKEKQAAHQRKIAETKRRKALEEQQAAQTAAAMPKKVKQTPLEIAINNKEKKEEEEEDNMRGIKKPYNPEVDDWEGMF